MAQAAPRQTPDLDAVIIGSGFAGLYMIHMARKLGLTARVFEAGPSVGGTWYWNCYPGARCDVDSLEYSFSFDDGLQQDWTWSERFAAQPEILAYLNHVADRLGLRDAITLSARVTFAHWDEARGLWSVGTDTGERVTARHVIAATGCLSAARAPDLPGADRFRGLSLHTGQWPQGGVDMSGKRVGVIGTGSSGIQVIPKLAETAAHVTVFQRTANFSIPARNTPTDKQREAEWKKVYDHKRREARQTTAGILYDYNATPALSVSPGERRSAYEARWAKGGVNFMRTFCDLVLDPGANETAADFVRGKIAQTVKDPTVAADLTPRDHPIGTKRICIDTDYYQTYNRDNVALVNLRRSPIAALTEAGIRTEDGAEYPLDAIVYATGFDAVTGALNAIDIRGAGGRPLRDHWADGPRSYLGLMCAGFPNLFTITGPGSPSILTNVVVSIEQHVEWIGAALAHLRGGRIEATAQAEADWIEVVQKAVSATLMTKADSWYMGANIPGKPRVFLPYAGGFAAYKAICDDIVARGYAGFRLEPALEPAL